LHVVIKAMHKGVLYRTETDAICDTGCDKSVIAKSLVPRTRILPCKQELLAVNKTVLTVLGQARVYFSIGDLNLCADMIVSDSVEEMILGNEWLKLNNAQWNCGKETLTIGGQQIQLKSKSGKDFVRKVYVKGGGLTIPDHVEMNVPVRMTIPGTRLRSVPVDWYTEKCELRPGVILARSLLPGSNVCTAVNVLNVSGREQVFKGVRYCVWRNQSWVC
jgi:hypothetical protein